MHVRAMNAIVGLDWPVDPTDVPPQGRVEPDRHVRGMRKPGVVGPDLFPGLTSHHDLRAHDRASSRPCAVRQPGSAVPDRPAAYPSGVLGRNVGEAGRVAVDESDTGVALEERDRPRQGVPREQVVGGHEHHVVAGGGLQTVVVGADVPQVLGLDEHRHARILLRQTPRHAALSSGDASSTISTSTSTPS